MRRHHPKLAALALGLILSIGLAELALRLVHPARAAGVGSGPLRDSWLPLSYDVGVIDRFAAGQLFLSFDPDLGWLPTPDADRPGWDGDVRYRTNHAGLRSDRDYSQTPPPGARRYAAYGDSFTYCETVDLAECWTQRLEQSLPRAEVLNFGVPAYGPDQAYLRYRRDGASWQPCAVLIGQMVENINRVVNRFRPFYVNDTPFAKPRFILEGDRLTLLPSPARQPEMLKDERWVETNLGPNDAWYYPGKFVANPFDWLDLVRLARTSYWRSSRGDGTSWEYHPGSPAFEVLFAVLARFADEVRANGATPVVLIFPYRQEILSQRDGGPKAHAALVKALKQRDIPTIDLTDALGEAARRVKLDDLIEYHYRAPGNAVVARELAGQLPRLAAGTCGSG